MSFNLKEFNTRKVTAASVDKTTEGQLSNNGKAPNDLQEKQLDKSRGKEAVELTEKQLEDTHKGDVVDSITELQLNNKGEAPNSTSEVQLDAERTSHSQEPIEKRLDNVRESLFNLKDFMGKVAAKKKVDKTTEGQLGNDDKGPNEVTDAQLESQRTGGESDTIEKRLEKARTGETTQLVEAQMDQSKSKLVKHRNPEASQGDISKIEEQRLAQKQTSESEKYEPASQTDKKLMLPEVKGKDGLKTASLGKRANKGNLDFIHSAVNDIYTCYSNGLLLQDTIQIMSAACEEFLTGQDVYTTKYGDKVKKLCGEGEMIGQASSSEVIKTASVKTARYGGTFDDAFPIGILEKETPGWDDTEPFVQIKPDLSELTRTKNRKSREQIREELEAKELSRGIDNIDDTELGDVEEIARQDAEKEEAAQAPDEDETIAGDENDELFSEVKTEDIDVGGASLRQIVLSYSPDNFSGPKNIKQEAALYLLSRYPSLFTYKVGKKLIEISQHLTLSPNDNTVVVTLPVDAFKQKVR